MSTSSYSSYSNESDEFPEIPPKTVIGDFEVYSLIGEGGYGQIYEVVNLKNQKHYAMKIEYLASHHKGLYKEISIMKEVQISCEFPEYIASGHTRTFRYLVMELLGPSLSSLCKKLPTKSLSKYTLLHIAVHMIRCIHAIHDMGYIHRDIKPGNFLIRPLRIHPICLIDFGLARRYITEKGAVRPPRENAGYTGTYRFASLNAHERKELSRRDDLFSWFYSMVELADGRLPWPPDDGDQRTVKMKREIKIEELTKMLTPEFVEIYEKINSLKYEDVPDYKGIIRLIKTAIKNQHFTQHKYDWELLNPARMRAISSIPLAMDEPASSDDEGQEEIQAQIKSKARRNSLLLSDPNILQDEIAKELNEDAENQA